MPIGKHCQICGQKKRPSEVIGEAHGIVVTAPCLMTVFGDPPWPADQVREAMKYCALCGSEQEGPERSHCSSCGAPLDAQTGKSDLEKIGDPAPRTRRIAAFLMDLVLISVLCTLAFMAVNRFERSRNDAKAVAFAPALAEPGEAVAEGEAAKVNIFSVMRYGSLLVVFILYHTLWTWLAGFTPGKLAFRARVYLANGSTRLGLGRSLLRSVLYLFTLYVIPIGLLPLIFQEPISQWPELIEQDGMFHNILTDTVVITPNR